MDISQKIRKAASQTEYIDVRTLSSDSEEILVENGNLSSLRKEFGFKYGVRAFYKGAWGFSHANDIKKFDSVLRDAIKLAKLNATKVKEEFRLADYPTQKANIKFKGRDPTSVGLEPKLKKIIEISKLLNKKEIENRTVGAAFAKHENSFFNSAGSETTETRYAYNFRSTVVGKKSGQIFRAFERFGKTLGYQDFEKINSRKTAELIHQRLLSNFKSKQAPAGRLPIVIDPRLCGVFFHEAVGHACEADAILEKSSVLAGKLGNRIAPESITLIDTPNIEEENGYYHFDSEGIPSAETVLIKNGILNNFLQSRETASKMHMAPTGNGRAESPEHMPCPRMSNTVLRAGTHSFEEALVGIKLGVYAKGSSGGVVEPTNGNFLFNAQEAFLIQNGKITKPLRDVSFGGNILEVLSKIEIVCKDSQRTFMGGVCGKKGQHVPVGEFCPHIKISEAMVGGDTNA